MRVYSLADKGKEVYEKLLKLHEDYYTRTGKYPNFVEMSQHESESLEEYFKPMTTYSTAYPKEVKTDVYILNMKVLIV